MPSYAKVVESSLKPLMINDTPLRILLAEDNQGKLEAYVETLHAMMYKQQVF
jgi:hypothetical protein